VGHYNVRYFCLFLMYVPLGTLYFFLMNIGIFFEAFINSKPVAWPELYFMPLFLFTFLLSISLTVAVGGLGAWNMYLNVTNQTTIEFNINSMNAEKAKNRGESYLNEFDLGTKRNLLVFFNVSKQHPWWKMLLPLRVPPVGDGTDYLKASNMLSRGGAGVVYEGMF
ncbi:hypothetical protein HK101_007213, partial [Irineochytrium annulatum]